MIDKDELIKLQERFERYENGEKLDEEDREVSD